MRKRITAFALVLAAVVTFGGGAGAQTPFGPSQRSSPFNDALTPVGSITVKVKLEVAGGDEVLIGEAADLSPLGDEDAHGLARRIGDDLGIPRTASEVVEADPSSDFSDDYLGVGLILRADDKISKREGDAWVFRADIARLTRSARLYGIADVDLSVCPADVAGVTDESSVRGNKNFDGCYSWTSSRSDTVTATIVHKPEPDGYPLLVAVMAAIAVVLALGASAIALLVRRHWLRTLSFGSIATIVVLTGLSLGSPLVAAIVLAAVGTPVNDFVFVNGYGDWKHFLAVAGPSLLLALPALAPALVLTRAGAPNYAAEPAVAYAPGGYQPSAPAQWWDQQQPQPQQPYQAQQTWDRQQPHPPQQQQPPHPAPGPPPTSAPPPPPPPDRTDDEAGPDTPWHRPD